VRERERECATKPGKNKGMKKETLFLFEIRLKSFICKPTKQVMHSLVEILFGSFFVVICSNNLLEISIC
jgi:hypothetical protein